MTSLFHLREVFHASAFQKVFLDATARLGYNVSFPRLMITLVAC